MPRLRTPLVLSAVVLAAAASWNPASAGMAFGVRAGWSSLSGDVFRGSGKVGGVDLFGIHAVFPVVPAVGLVLAGETRTDEIRFDRAGFGNAALSGAGEWRDLAFLASLRVRLVPLGIGPAGLYAGGGIGAHVAEFEVTEAAVVPPGKAAGPLAPLDVIDDFRREVEERKTDFAWHLLAGASIGLPALPLSVFAEARFEEVTGDMTPRGTSVYGGVNLELP